jgi:hypothetical protein
MHQELFLLSILIILSENLPSRFPSEPPRALIEVQAELFYRS